jgi:hypothetical protein
MKIVEDEGVQPAGNRCIDTLPSPDARAALSVQVLPAVAKLVLVHFHWQVSQILDR